MKISEQIVLLQEALEKVWVDIPLDELPYNARTGTLQTVCGSELLNLDDIYVRMDCSVRRVLRVLGVFYESQAELLEMIDCAQSRLDTARLRAIAHSLRGVFLEVGAMPFANMAARVESLEHEISGAEAQTALRGLRRGVVTTSELIHELLALAS